MNLILKVSHIIQLFKIKDINADEVLKPGEEHIINEDFYGEFDENIS